jgi:hypothetical protein
LIMTLLRESFRGGGADELSFRMKEVCFFWQQRLESLVTKEGLSMSSLYLY